MAKIPARNERLISPQEMLCNIIIKVSLWLQGQFLSESKGICINDIFEVCEV